MVQLQVLNKIIKDKDSSILLLNNLSADYFSDYHNEYNFIKSHLNQYGTIPDQVTFLSKFPDFEIFDVTSLSAFKTSKSVSFWNLYILHFASMYSS